MTLDDWMTQENVSDADFARGIERTPQAVNRYRKGERIPDRETMPRIVAFTKGAVTPNDFFGVGAKPEDEAA